MMTNPSAINSSVASKMKHYCGNCKTDKECYGGCGGGSYFDQKTHESIPIIGVFCETCNRKVLEKIDLKQLEFSILFNKNIMEHSKEKISFSEELIKKGIWSEDVA